MEGERFSHEVIERLLMITSSHRQLSRKSSSFSLWSNIPSELLETIVKKLEPNNNPETIQQLRYVCKSWRSVIPPPILSLSPLLPFKFSSSILPKAILAIHEPMIIQVVPNVVYVVKKPFCRRRLEDVTSGRGWLIAVEQTSPGKVRLLHPLTGEPVDKQTLPEGFPVVPSINNFTAVEVSRGYSLRLSDGITSPLLGKSKTYHVTKVLLWQNPNRPNNLDIKSCSLMLLHKSGKLVCVRLSPQFSTLAYIRYSKLSNFDDIVLYDYQDIGQVLAVDRKGKLYGIEYVRMLVTTLYVAQPMDERCIRRRKRLMFDRNKNIVYMIVRDDAKIRLYRLVWRQNSWAEYSPTEWNVFVSFDSCFMVRTTELPGFDTGNYVVFPKNCFQAYNKTSVFSDDFLFDKDGITDEYLKVCVSKFRVEHKIDVITSCPGSSKALWPPPKWLWENTSPSIVPLIQSCPGSSSQSLWPPPRWLWNDTSSITPANQATYHENNSVNEDDKDEEVEEEQILLGGQKQVNGRELGGVEKSKVVSEYGTSMANYIIHPWCT